MSFPKNARPSLSLRRRFFGIARLTVYAYPLSLPFDVTPAVRRPLFRVPFRAGFSDRRASSSSSAAARSSLAFNPFFVRLDFIFIIDSVLPKLYRCTALTSKRDRLERNMKGFLLSSFLSFFTFEENSISKSFRNLENYIYHVCVSLSRCVLLFRTYDLREDLKIHERKTEIEKNLEIKGLKESQNRGSESKSSFDVRFQGIKESKHPKIWSSRKC